ncbi:MAG TPA: TRIC cation channel family protein [Anaeromyxobacteraceae bacterium]|nr:TRIC cation channel family protein [Anaeromyxobacteraceae bacterium]
MPHLDHPFQTAVGFDLAAIYLFAVTGGLAGIRKRYDLVGLSALALATALSGGILRDLLLARGTPVLLTDGRYLAAVLAGTITSAAMGHHLHRVRLAIEVVDALGLGIYGVVGAQKALAAGLPVLTALLLGSVNAVGGSIVRDVLSREEPLLFKPGEWYALAAILGTAAFLVLQLGAHVPPYAAAVGGIGVAFTTRLLAIRLGWRTDAVSGAEEGP